MKSLILGFGISGRAVASFFERRNIEYCVYEDQNIDLYKEGYLGKLINLDEVKEYDFDTLIPSPGIHPNHQIYQFAIRNNWEILGEIELALRFLDTNIIGITGTNGKTTVTKFIKEGLELLGVKSAACGNYGEPLISFVDKKELPEVLCVEMSSYQLETTWLKKVDYAVILNITQDHLDRYENMRSYADAKYRLIDLVKDTGKCFIQKKAIENFMPNQQKFFIFDSSTFQKNELKKFSDREKENWIAGYLILQQYGMTQDQFLKHISVFKKPEHRIELVDEVEGISYYDDSKGTNIDAVLFAVENFNMPIILLCGGKDKQSDYSPWVEGLKDKVKKIITFGSAKEIIYQTLKDHFYIEKVITIQEAVENARRSGNKGDVVLLSPGCSSFDQFKDYKHRAQVFRQTIQDIKFAK